MLPLSPTPLVRLGNLFPDRAVYAKCEFLAPSGSFKIRGARHLLGHLRQQDRSRLLVVPSMGNTALGAAVAARANGFTMVGVVPNTITRAKHEKLQALGVELVTVAGGGSELLRVATEIATERGGYFVHPHLDPLWTDGYQSLVAEVRHTLPECRSLVLPVGGGGLLLGVLAALRTNPGPLRVIGCEPFNFPKYARFSHPRTATIADGLLLDVPHPVVQQAIADNRVEMGLVPEDAIRSALRDLFETQGLVIEPSCAVPLAYVQAHQLEEPICVVLTGENITREDHRRLIGRDWPEDQAGPRQQPEQTAPRPVDELCREHGLDARKLAELSGVEEQRVLAIVLGRWTPSPADRDAIAAVFGRTREQIIWGHKTPIQHLYGQGPA
jgi:threonine dehydratase